MPSNAILVCAASPPLRSALDKTLTDAGYRVTSLDNPGEALAALGSGQFDVLVAEGVSVFATLGVMRSAAPGRVTPVIVLGAADDVEARIAFLEAGADDVLRIDFDPREIEARVEALLIRYGRLVPGSDGRGPTVAQVIAFFSPKGGVGTTTLAVNTAAVLADRRRDRVLLVDLDLQFGQVATHLDLAPRFDITSLASDEVALNDADMAAAYLTPHDSGIWVLPSPPTPDSEASVTADHIERMLNTLGPRFDRIVIDCGSKLDARTLIALEHSESHVFVVLPELAALKAMSAMLAFLAETAAIRARTHFVMNHLFPKELLKTRDVEGLLQARLSGEVPYTEIHMMRAINEGSPVALSRPDAPAAVALERLAELIVGMAAAPEPAETGKGERRSLFRRG